MNDIEAHMREAEELIRELLAVEFTPRREVEINRRLSKICPDPAWSHRIFHDPETREASGRTDVKLAVKKIFDYKPIQLTDRSNEVLD